MCVYVNVVRMPVVLRSSRSRVVKTAPISSEHMASQLMREFLEAPLLGSMAVVAGFDGMVQHHNTVDASMQQAQAMLAAWTQTLLSVAAEGEGEEGAGASAVPQPSVGGVAVEGSAVEGGDGEGEAGGGGPSATSREPLPGAEDSDD